MLDRTEFSLGARVNELMEGCSGNSKHARDELIRFAAIDGMLRNELIALGADQAVRNFFTSQRRTVVTDTEMQRYTPRTVEQTEKLEQRRQEKLQRREFWDRYSLFGHLPLRISKASNLRDSAKARRKQAAGNIRCAAFEEDLMNRMKDDRERTVSQLFPIRKVIEIAREHHVIK